MSYPNPRHFPRCGRPGLSSARGEFILKRRVRSRGDLPLTVDTGLHCSVFFLISYFGMLLISTLSRHLQGLNGNTCPQPTTLDSIEACNLLSTSEFLRASYTHIIKLLCLAIYQTAPASAKVPATMAWKERGHHEIRKPAATLEMDGQTSSTSHRRLPLSCREQDHQGHGLPPVQDKHTMTRLFHHVHKAQIDRC